MSPATRPVELTAPDGGSFHGQLTLPDVTPAPAVLLLHEIFGVNEYMADVATRLATLGYVVLAPDLFWRIDPDHPLDHTDESIGIAFERVGNLDVTAATADATWSLDELAALPEVEGTPSVLGFCLGGTLALAVGLHGAPAAVVSYYGSGVADLLTDVDDLRCPAMFVFGTADPFIPNEVADAVAVAFADRDDVSIHRLAAGHAFDNSFADSFHDRAAALTAWGLTADFLARHRRT